jgi:hypothetical protein
VNEATIAVNAPGAMTESSKMSDLLSAASLLLTVLGIVYGTWYTEIVNAIAIVIPGPVDDRVHVRRTVRAALYGKALPLALAATMLMVLFLPDALAIVRGGFSLLNALGCGAFREYNAVEAAFCLVVVFTGALAAYLIFLVCQLKVKLGKINTP